MYFHFFGSFLKGDEILPVYESNEKILKKTNQHSVYTILYCTLLYIQLIYS